MGSRIVPLADDHVILCLVQDALGSLGGAINNYIGSVKIHLDCSEHISAYRVSHSTQRCLFQIKLPSVSS